MEFVHAFCFRHWESYCCVSTLSPCHALTNHNPARVRSRRVQQLPGWHPRRNATNATIFHHHVRDSACESNARKAYLTGPNPPPEAHSKSRRSIVGSEGENVLATRRNVCTLPHSASCVLRAKVDHAYWERQ